MENLCRRPNSKQQTDDSDKHYVCFNVNPSAWVGVKIGSAMWPTCARFISPWFQPIPSAHIEFVWTERCWFMDALRTISSLRTSSPKRSIFHLFGFFFDTWHQTDGGNKTHHIHATKNTWQRHLMHLIVIESTIVIFHVFIIFFSPSKSVRQESRGL